MSQKLEFECHRCQVPTWKPQFMRNWPYCDECYRFIVDFEAMCKRLPDPMGDKPK